MRSAFKDLSIFEEYIHKLTEVKPSFLTKKSKIFLYPAKTSSRILAGEVAKALPVLKNHLKETFTLELRRCHD